MEALGDQIGRMLRPGDLVVLTGPLGAGKTTLTRGIAAGLGVRGPVQSPTFVIARTHPSLVGGAPLVHVDAYRLGSPANSTTSTSTSTARSSWSNGAAAWSTDSGTAWWEVELDRRLGGRGADTHAAGPRGPTAGARRRRPAHRHDHPARRRLEEPTTLET